MPTDPVCGMTVDEDDPPETYEHEGETYYFCPKGCRRKFMDNPEKYLPRDDGRERWSFHP